MKAEYGVFLNIHPGGQKRVTLHVWACSHYKQHWRRGTAKGMYTFHKDCKIFQELIDRASKWALEWHAPIEICKGCLYKFRHSEEQSDEESHL